MEQPRKVFRFYLSTLLTFVLVVGMFMWVTMEYPDHRWALKKDGRGPTYCTQIYGFPFAAIDIEYVYMPANKIPQYAGLSVRPWGLMGDLLVIASMLGWIYWLGEIRRDRPPRRHALRRVKTPYHAMR